LQQCLAAAPAIVYKPPAAVTEYGAAGRNFTLAPALIVTGRLLMTDVEVFRTNVTTRRKAATLLRNLRACFPAYRITFDLTDCDRVLRVESPEGLPDAGAVAALLQAHGYACVPLPD